MSEIVKAGMLAPSGDNCQPWRFEWNGQRLEIYFLPERAESLYDVNNTASWISLGAVLTNMQIASTQFGVEQAVELIPHSDSNLVARINFTQLEQPQAEPLFPILAKRCVNRGSYENQMLTSELKQELSTLSKSVPGTQIDIIEEKSAKARIAALAAYNDVILFNNRDLHSGLYRWMRWTREETARSADGMPIETLELNAFDRTGFRAMASWNIAQLMKFLGSPLLLRWRSSRVYRHSSAMVLLSMNGTDAVNFVRAGELLERLWLTITLRGLAFQPITGITCLMLRCRIAGGGGLSSAHQSSLAAIEDKLALILPAFKQKTPVMLFRLGSALKPPSGRTLRRSLDTVLRTTVK